MAAIPAIIYKIFTIVQLDALIVESSKKERINVIE